MNKVGWIQKVIVLSGMVMVGALYLGKFAGCNIILGIWNGVRQIDFEYS